MQLRGAVARLNQLGTCRPGPSADEDWYEAEAEMRERFAAPDSHVETVSTNPGGEAAAIETKRD